MICALDPPAEVLEPVAPDVSPSKNGAKMSKSKGNVVSPDDMIARYGADATRMYSLFAAPPDRDLDWQEDGVAGVSRFLGRVYRLVTSHASQVKPVSMLPRQTATRPDSCRERFWNENCTRRFENHAGLSPEGGTSILASPRSWNLVNLLGEHEDAIVAPSNRMSWHAS